MLHFSEFLSIMFDKYIFSSLEICMFEKFKDVVKKSALRVIAASTGIGIGVYNYDTSSKRAAFYHDCANDPTTCGTQEDFLERLGNEHLGYLTITVGSISTIAALVVFLNLLRLAQLKKENTADTAVLMNTQFQRLNDMRGELIIWLLLLSALSAGTWYGTYATFTHPAELRDQISNGPFPPSDMSNMHHHGDMYSQAQWAFVALCITLTLYTGYAIAKASGVKFSDTISTTLHNWRLRRHDEILAGRTVQPDDGHSFEEITIQEAQQPLLRNTSGEDFNDGEDEIVTENPRPRRTCTLL